MSTAFTSAVASSITEEVEKLVWSCRWGGDTLMDLSTGKDIDNIRKQIIEHSPVPIGTVPIYKMLEELGGNIEDMNAQHFLDMVEHQAQQGVDYMTVHAGLLREHLPLLRERARRGSATVVGGIYDLATGRVEFLDVG